MPPYSLSNVVATTGASGLGYSIGIAGKILLGILCVATFVMFGESLGGCLLALVGGVSVLLLILAGGAARGLGIAILVVVLVLRAAFKR